MFENTSVNKIITILRYRNASKKSITKHHSYVQNHDKSYKKYKEQRQHKLIQQLP